MPADEQTLAEGVWSVARRLRLATREALAPWDISPSHARALDSVAGHGPLRLSALAEQLRIAPRSATEVVDTLEDRGWVRRAPDPSDRRATLVELTTAGARAHRAIGAARDASAEQVFAALSDPERARLSRILRRLR
jgi:DNA-binding MarR family transcriptional regulator